MVDAPEHVAAIITEAITASRRAPELRKVSP
jgi:hypothetical protein